MQNSKLVVAMLGLSLLTTQLSVRAADQGGCDKGDAAGMAAIGGLFGALAGNAGNKGDA